MFDKGNYDFDHRLPYGPNKHIPYGCILDRKQYHSCMWASDRKQTTSSVARRNYMRSNKKHARQLLQQELKEMVSCI
jgi:hypothetical protein